jgi:hypothetical protein
VRLALLSLVDGPALVATIGSHLQQYHRKILGRHEGDHRFCTLALMLQRSVLSLLAGAV